MDAADNLGPLADDYSKQDEERRELMRIAAVRALQHSDNGRRLEPDARRWALHWAAIKPLGRPLSPGDPAQARAHFTEAA